MSAIKPGTQCIISGCPNPDINRRIVTALEYRPPMATFRSKDGRLFHTKTEAWMCEFPEPVFAQFLRGRAKPIAGETHLPVPVSMLIPIGGSDLVKDETQEKELCTT